jgi:hypothetical protein
MRSGRIAPVFGVKAKNPISGRVSRSNSLSRLAAR